MERIAGQNAEYQQDMSLAKRGKLDPINMSQRNGIGIGSESYNKQFSNSNTGDDNYNV
jgi:hypothetical protein